MNDTTTDWATTPVTALALATTGIAPDTSELCGWAMVTATAEAGITDLRHTPVATTTPIPEEASAIHGITNDIARWSQSPQEAAEEIAGRLAEVTHPVMAFNAPWVFATLQAHMQRTEHSPAALNGPLIDPLVLDKRNIARVAAGGRTLTGTRQRWNLTPSRSGAAPVVASDVAQLGLTMIQAVPQFRRLSAVELSENSAQWYLEAEEDMQAFLRSKGKEPEGALPWPGA